MGYRSDVAVRFTAKEGRLENMIRYIYDSIDDNFMLMAEEETDSYNETFTLVWYGIKWYGDRGVDAVEKLLIYIDDEDENCPISAAQKIEIGEDYEDITENFYGNTENIDSYMSVSRKIVLE